MADEVKEEAIPGPWEASTRDGTLKVRGPATAKKYKQREVCRVYGANRATVDLIVAAPDLLAALEGMMAWQRTIPDLLPDELFEQVRTALAKAKGT